jgi:hypothetical protein
VSCVLKIARKPLWAATHLLWVSFQPTLLDFPWNKLGSQSLATSDDC